MTILVLPSFLIGLVLLFTTAKSQNVRGTPGVDYPNYYSVPSTSFKCSDQKYIPGFYADVESRCQVFHFCFDTRKESFLCPVGTTFNQRKLTCDYWFRTNCTLAPSYYDVNVGPAMEKMAKNIPWLLKMRNRAPGSSSTTTTTTTTTEAPTTAGILDKMTGLFEETNKIKDEFKSILNVPSPDGKEADGKRDKAEQMKKELDESIETEHSENKFPIGEVLDEFLQDATEYDPTTHMYLELESTPDWQDEVSKTGDEFENFYNSKFVQGRQDDSLQEGLNSALGEGFHVPSQQAFESDAENKVTDDFEFSDTEFSKRLMEGNRRRRKPIYFVVDNDGEVTSAPGELPFEESNVQYYETESIPIDSAADLNTEAPIHFQGDSDLENEEAIEFDNVESNVDDASQDFNPEELLNDEPSSEHSVSFSDFLETTSVLPLDMDSVDQDLMRQTSEQDEMGTEFQHDIYYGSNEVPEAIPEQDSDLPLVFNENVESEFYKESVDSNIPQSDIGVPDQSMQSDDVYVYSDEEVSDSGVVDESMQTNENEYAYPENALQEGTESYAYSDGVQREPEQWAYQEVPDTASNFISVDGSPYSQTEMPGYVNSGLNPDYYSYVQRGMYYPAMPNSFPQIQSPYFDPSGRNEISGIPGYNYPEQFYRENYGYPSNWIGQGQSFDNSAGYAYLPNIPEADANYLYESEQTAVPEEESEYREDGELYSPSNEFGFAETSEEVQSPDLEEEQSETYYEIEDEPDLSRVSEEHFKGNESDSTYEFEENIDTPEEEIDAETDELDTNVQGDEAVSEEEIYYELDDEPEEMEAMLSSTSDSDNESERDSELREDIEISQEMDSGKQPISETLDSDERSVASGSNFKPSARDSSLMDKLLPSANKLDEAKAESASQGTKAFADDLLHEGVESSKPREHSIPDSSIGKPFLDSPKQSSRNGRRDFTAPSENEFLNSAMFQSPMGFGSYGFNTAQQFKAVDPDSMQFSSGQSFSHKTGSISRPSRSKLSSLQERMRSMKEGKFGIFRNYLNPGKGSKTNVAF